MENYIYRTLFTFPQKDVLLWHLQEGSLERSFPQTEDVTISTKSNSDANKIVWHFSIREFLFKHQWVLESNQSVERSALDLNMLKGPFNHFSLKVYVKRVGVNSCELVEEVCCKFKCSKWFHNFRAKILEKRLKRFFEYKHEVLSHDLLLFSKYPAILPQKILIAGASGLVGKALVSFLKCAGHQVKTLVRNGQNIKDDQVCWNPETGEAELSELEGFDSIVNLAGVNIADKRWTQSVKHNIFSSRIFTTERLVKLLASLASPPQTLLCASAVGYYGEHDSQEVAEECSQVGNSFLGETCKRWEQASKRISISGTRVVNLRFGTILSAKQGALKQILKFFKLGCGAVIGSGKQYMSWIAIDDTVAAIYHCMMKKEVVGPVNISSPNAITNKDFSSQLSLRLNKPLGPRFSSPLVLFIYGQMGEELLLTSIRAVPAKLDQSGFVFRYPSLRQALRHII
ncbi:MAG: TIGR01777 family oxidoreductase [Rhabdochlamydiaceae bacterium]|nr:TIGR01777 family oxidoreductase [Candidatus Amphrikana amoebophyrae]